MKLLGNISVDFDVTNQLMSRFLTFVGHWKRNGSAFEITSAMHRFQESI
jgi:hypothetical protein